MKFQTALNIMGIHNLRDLSLEDLVSIFNNVTSDKIKSAQVLKVSIAWLREQMESEDAMQRKPILRGLLNRLVRPGALKVGVFRMARLRNAYGKLHSEVDKRTVDGYARHQLLLSEV